MIREITFEEIYPVWNEYLWPNRATPIEPINGMMFMGGYDATVLEKYQPTFFGYYIENQLVGVNSGFRTSEYSYRSRGIYVRPKYRRLGIAQDLLDITIQTALKENCSLLWTIPRKEALPTYESVGFKQIGPWFDKEMEFGPNCYAYKVL